MVWLVDKRFEFTVHHDLAVCKRLLWDLRSPVVTTASGHYSPRAVYVILSGTDEGIAFQVEKRLGGNIWVEARGTLREGPDATVVVSGHGQIPRFEFLIGAVVSLFMTMFALGTVPVLVRSEPYVILLLIPALIPSVMLGAMMVARNRLVYKIVDTLSDRRKAKKKS